MDKTLAWVVVGILALVIVIALVVRFVAGLHWVEPLALSSRSDEYNKALCALRKCDPADDDAAFKVREQVLKVCRERARDAEDAAEKKERWAAVATLGLALAVALTGAFAVSLITP